LKHATGKDGAKSDYRGMHNGTVSGKGFERSRRNRKSHQERRVQRSEHERRLCNGK